MDLYKILIKMQSGEADRTEIKLLFRLMFNICREYFRRSNKNFLFNSIILPEDAAMETVTPLFTGDGENKFEKLNSAFNRWHPEVLNHKDALFFIHQLSYIRCEHYLVNALKKHNPNVSAFVNYLNIRIKEGGYHKQHYCGTVYITNSEKITPGKNLIRAEDFLLIYDKLFFKKKLLLENLFNYIQQAGFFPAVPFYLIIERIKKLNHPEIQTVQLDESLSQDIFIEEAADAGLSICVKKLMESYSGRNKLSSEETAAFEKTLRDIRFDLTDGGISGGYYEYFHKHMPELSTGEFKTKYENILEYLVKILKQSTIMLLKQD